MPGYLLPGMPICISLVDGASVQGGAAWRLFQQAAGVSVSYGLAHSVVGRGDSDRVSEGVVNSAHGQIFQNRVFA